MGYNAMNPRPRKVVVNTADGGEWSYRSASFIVHPHGDLEVKDAVSGDTVSIWARGMWQHATAPRQ